MSRLSTFIRTLMMALVISGVLVTAGPGWAEEAAPAVYEPFAVEAEVGADLAGQGGGSGFGGTWMLPDSGVTAKVVEGLSLGDLPVSGKAASFTRADEFNAKRYAFRAVDRLQPGAEVWMSYLAKWTEDNGGDGHSAELGVGTYSHKDDASMKFFTNVLTSNKNDAFAIGYASEKLETTSDVNTRGKLVLVVGRWAGVGTENQQATLWLFDKADAVNAILKADSEKVLDEHAFAKQTVTGRLP